MRKCAAHKSTGLRIDVTYIKPDGYREYGLVDYPPGTEPTSPTLFIGAYCKTEADARWLQDTVDAIVRQVETVVRERKGG